MGTPGISYANEAVMMDCVKCGAPMRLFWNPLQSSWRSRSELSLDSSLPKMRLISLALLNLPPPY